MPPDSSNAFFFDTTPPLRPIVRRKRLVSPAGWTSLALLLAAIPLAYFLADRPVARFAHTAIGPAPIFLDLTRIPEFLTSASAILLVVLGIAALARGGLRGWPNLLFLAALSNQLANTLKDELKLAFGRTWPETWVNANPSFIHDGAFGFHPFHGGTGWASFPSGHMTAVMSVAAVLCAARPRLWPLGVAVALAVAVGLIGMDYHFVSDISAGTLLGACVGLATLRLARTTPA